jgi:P27 family predicted phage terminase small subunit
MGNPKKPTALNNLAGNPGRRKPKKVEPTYAPISSKVIPPSPPQLSEAGTAEWNRLCYILGEFGVITEADQEALALYCYYFGVWIEAVSQVKSGCAVVLTDKGPRINPWYKIAADAEDRMRRYLLEFGMTPASRSKVNANKKGGKSGSIRDLLD